MPSHTGQRRLPVLYEKSPALYPSFFASAVRAKILRSSSCTLAYVATVERTFIPMGVASMSFTWSMPSASIEIMCSGIFLPQDLASSAGTRLSSTSVVLPEPETPVTTVSLRLGIFASSGFTVCIAPVLRVIAPYSNIFVGSACCLTGGRSALSRNLPIFEFLSCISCSTVPCAIIFPPAAPAPGPISIIWSATESICTSWSTRITELPSATRSFITPVSPTILEGCRPIDGSSSTYKTPVVRLRTARASCILWRSPVESVDAARSSDRYPSPKSVSRFAVERKDKHMLSAIGRMGSGRVEGTFFTHSTSFSSVILQASSRGMPHSLGARAASHSLEPPQSGQMSCFKNFSTRFIPLSSLTLASAFSTV